MTALETPLLKWHITFGVQYSYESHPTFPEAHPDAWVTVLAADYTTARSIAMANFLTHWSFMYTPEEFQSHYQPRGEIAVIDGPTLAETRDSDCETVEAHRGEMHHGGSVYCDLCEDEWPCRPYKIATRRLELEI